MAAFRFKQFSVEQEQVAMKVGTDGVLLGAWTNCADAPRNPKRARSPGIHQYWLRVFLVMGAEG